MKIHLNQISDHGLHLEGEEATDYLDLNDVPLEPLGPVRYLLDLGLSEGGLFATGTLALDLQLECVSCLEKFSYPLRVDAFALQTELDGRETVDLTPFLREDILLVLPSYPHCDWNGERVCPGATRTTTDVSSESHAWDKLNKLKIRKNH